MELHPYGPEAWLIDGLDDCVGWAAGVAHTTIDGVIEVVPAEDTVLVRCRRELLGSVADRLGSVVPMPSTRADRSTTIDVRYDGPDLGDVAARTGLSVEEVVRTHSAAQYTVAFCGFSPGFAYLAGLPEVLRLPRRAEPRTSVPAGSLAIAAHYSAVYPSASPGGWHLIGSTDAAIWDVTREEPALLVPGTLVHFRSTT